VLPSARSAVAFALPLDQDKIENFIAKRDRAGQRRESVGCPGSTGG
tara:strand:- start:2422 stop:2559 length:138 start_codon:yes stop_codon:yes gene_type:complete